MSTFIANKYDPNTDPNYPIVDTLYDNDKKIIKKVKHIEVKDLYAMFSKGEQPQLDGFEGVDIMDNPERPFLKYMIWFISKS